MLLFSHVGCRPLFTSIGRMFEGFQFLVNFSYLLVFRRGLRIGCYGEYFEKKLYQTD